MNCIPIITCIYFVLLIVTTISRNDPIYPTKHSVFSIAQMTEGDEREPTERLPGIENRPVVEAPPPPPSPPDLTDKLNKRLLTSFLDRLNNGQVRTVIFFESFIVTNRVPYLKWLVWRPFYTPI